MVALSSWVQIHYQTVRGLHVLHMFVLVLSGTLVSSNRKCLQF